MTYKIFMSLIFGVLIVAASLPIVFLIICFNKSFCFLSCLRFLFYFNWGILGTVGTSISAAKIAFLNSFPVICVMNWTSGLMMDHLQKDNLLPEAYAIVPTTCHTIFIMAITVILSLWLIIRFYKNGRGKRYEKYYKNRIFKIKAIFRNKSRNYYGNTFSVTVTVLFYS